MSKKRKPDNEVTKNAIWFREYRAKKKAGIPVDTARYTPSFTKDDLITLGITVEKADNEFGYNVYQFGRLKKIKIRTYNKPKYSPESAKCALASIYYRDKKQTRTVSLARLVYVAFIGDIPEGYVVDHKNGQPLDNTLSNLRLLSRSDNTYRAGHNQYTYLNNKETINEGY